MKDSQKKQIKHDIAHHKRVEGVYVKKIEQQYMAAVIEASQLAGAIGPDVSLEKMFKFSDYPAFTKRIDNIFDSMHVKIVKTIDEETTAEWLAAAEKNDELVNDIVKHTKFTKTQVQHLYNRNLDALQAFQRRKEQGMDISQRVWRYTKQFKKEIELGLDVALSEGKPAAQLASEFKQYLREPDKLFRRVRDIRGDLVLSQNAKAYHPGQGVYRSSYKNALRFTRTEINMAYRASDYERIQQLDFVIGIQVKRSNHYYYCPLCDSLVGKYPKDFKFRGWHPCCRCFETTILSSIDEFLEAEKMRMSGLDVSKMKFAGEVTDVPDGYRKWIADNTERLEKAKSKPYFIKDNPTYSKVEK